MHRVLDQAARFASYSAPEQDCRGIRVQSELEMAPELQQDHSSTSRRGRNRRRNTLFTCPETLEDVAAICQPDPSEAQPTHLHTLTI